MANKIIVQKTIGDITVKSEASSEHGDVSMEELLAIAKAAVTQPDEDAERSKKLEYLDKRAGEGYNVLQTSFADLTSAQLDAEVEWAEYVAKQVEGKQSTEQLTRQSKIELIKNAKLALGYSTLNDFDSYTDNMLDEELEEYTVEAQKLTEQGVTFAKPVLVKYEGIIIECWTTDSLIQAVNTALVNDYDDLRLSR